MLQSLKNVTFTKVFLIIQSAFIMAWMANLSGTDSLYSVYALCGIICIFCMAINFQNGCFKPRKGLSSIIVMASFFSIITFVANYGQFTHVWYGDDLYYSTNILKNAANSVFSLIGGFFVGYQILLFVVSSLPLSVSDKENTFASWKIFLISFLSIVLVNSLYLFLDEYPAHITPDALYQIQQGYLREYVNDHPFWHTFFIKCILGLGYGVTGSPNAAIALHSFIQILFIAGCFSFAIMTLYEARVPALYLISVFVIFALMPYNIVFSITISKDVPFALSLLLMIVSLYRILSSMGNRQIWNYFLLCIGAFLVCIMRTNGLVVIGIFVLVLLPFVFKRNKWVILLLVVVLLIALILTGPVLTAMGVGESHISEALCLPLQQMARVISEGCPLTESQTILLSRIFSLEDIPSIYTEWYADPVKIELHNNDYQYFTEHLLDYAKVWLELGLEYPVEYLKAWVEQTKGYWNGGYSYFQYVEMMQENSYGFVKTSGNNIVAKLFYLYFGVTKQIMFFEPLNSIGLHVWLLVLCWYLNVRNKRIEWLLCIPGIVIILGLMLGTPVFAEFRYAYPIFTTLPFIAGVTLFSKSSSEL